MLNNKKTLYDEVNNVKILAGASISAEGMPLIISLENGEQVVSPATGVADEVFGGFSFAHNILPVALTRVNRVTVPVASPFTVQLDRNNLVTGQISGKGVADGQAFTYHVDTPGDNVIVPNDTTGVITFHTADAGQVVDVLFKYTPTALELREIMDEPDVNINPAFEIVGRMGVIRGDEVHTDVFDASVDWAADLDAVYLGAGILTNSGNVQIPWHIVHVPTVDSPFLGIRRNV